MKTLVVLDGNCGEYERAYQEWLSKNLPADVRLDWRCRESGVGGGLFDEDYNEIDNPYWKAFCR